MLFGGRMINIENLNKEQQKGVLATEGPVLILAGAGSGKTRVLTNRTAYLIKEKNVNPYHILAITFTNKAAAEMRERIDEMVGHGSESIWVSTFHSLCVRILRRYADRIGYSTNFTIYDSDDQKSMMKVICKRLEIDTKMYKEKMFLGVISKAKDELVSPEEFAMKAGADFNEKRKAQVYVEYQKSLKKNNAMDFDDLIGKTVDLLRVDSQVREYYQDRFRYIMVDEYQDTNTAQFTLIEILAGKYKNLCVVGDDDQSIYKFRGANIENILNFEQYYPNSAVIKLEQNYRSTQNILNAANGVIGNNIGRKVKALWTEEEPGESIQLQEFDVAQEETEFVALDIERHVRNGQDYKDHAILYRTNAQSRMFEEKFVNLNIPYKVVGGVNFYGRKEVKDILAYLKTIANGQDDLAVRRIINVPKRGIGATSVTKVQNYAIEQEISFFEALKQANEIPGIGKSAEKLLSFAHFIQVFRSEAEYLGVERLLKKVIEDTGYVRELELERSEEADSRIENIDELISKAVSFEQSAEALESDQSLLGLFLEEVALVADIDSLDQNSDYVVLMTFHGAKGLEFPNVYMVGMEDGLFPSYMAITGEDRSELEEERRLCYVGITRAKQLLTITSAKQRMIRGETRYSKLSRFVKEIPLELFARVPRVDKIEEMPTNLSFKQALKTFHSKPFVTETTKLTSLEYQEGDRVVHGKFGEGVVLNILEGGRDYEVTVDFDLNGIKKMFASFAKLRKS